MIPQFFKTSFPLISHETMFNQLPEKVTIAGTMFQTVSGKAIKLI